MMYARPLPRRVMMKCTSTQTQADINPKYEKFNQQTQANFEEKSLAPLIDQFDKTLRVRSRLERSQKLSIDGRQPDRSIGACK